jgi:hypothetical protein
MVRQTYHGTRSAAAREFAHIQSLVMQLVGLVGPGRLWAASAMEGQKIAMSRSLLAPLSPNEEITLRRVALGLSPAEDLPPRDLARLAALALVDATIDRPRLTLLGRQRYHSVAGGEPAAPPPVRD